MRRYQVPAWDPLHEAWVGWDPPLQTFFAQVFGPPLPDGEDDCLRWIGTRPHQFLTVEALRADLRGWAIVSELVDVQLRYDQTFSPPPSPLQRRLVRLMEDEPYA